MNSTDEVFPFPFCILRLHTLRGERLGVKSYLKRQERGPAEGALWKTAEQNAE